MLPKIVGAITDPESYDFYSKVSSQEDCALAWRRLVLDQLSETQYREQIRRAIKSSLIYGNGVIEVGFEEYSEEATNFESVHSVKRVAMLPHPIHGNIPIPLETEEKFRRSTKRSKNVRPYVRYVSLIDFYVDPNCESPFLQDAGYVIKRVYMRAEDLKALRGVKDFDIPDDGTLAQYSQAKTTANQDVTKLSTELFRYNLWNPAQDYSGDPAQKRIEVIEYTRKNRKVWMLNREHVAYNQPNRYGEINYFSLPYADVLDRWHALALSDVAEGEQRLQQTIINARIDELALSIHPPTIKRRGVTIPAYQLKRRPGVVIETENPEGDIVQEKIQDITQQAYVEVDASQRRTQQLTGITDLAGYGTPAAGGNSANRTATGVNTQVSATQDRIGYYVENAESLLVEPVLNALIRYDKKFLDMDQAAGWITADPAFQKLKPLDVMNCQVYAECRAAIKMRARQGFLQVFPLFAQYYLNPEYLQLLAQQAQKTISAEESMRMLLDAINYAPRSPLVIDLTQEQVQALKQPPPEEQLKAQMMGQQQQADLAIHEKQNITKLLNTLLSKSFDAHTKLSELDDKHIQAVGQVQQEGEDESSRDET